MASAAGMVLAIALATLALGGDGAAIRDLASSDLAVRRSEDYAPRAGGSETGAGRFTAARSNPSRPSTARASP